MSKKRYTIRVIKNVVVELDSNIITDELLDSVNKSTFNQESFTEEDLACYIAEDYSLHTESVYEMSDNEYVVDYIDLQSFVDKVG